jgi:hypothetical protein
VSYLLPTRLHLLKVPPPSSSATGLSWR